ncbi:DUF4913 domain-containing protein [Streptomyces sparsogenes]|uniref:DUF4913 domain-containing protein n=1 Tax=Streptomyces sparsogenes TaxID=67365 RepID=UPI0034057A78
MSDPSKATPEPFRVPDGDLDDLASTLAKTMAEVRQHGVILDRLGSEPVPTPQSTADTSTAGADGADKAAAPASVFILALGGEAYAVELAALSDWVNHLFLPVYGREISTTRPWCDQWHEHPEAGLYWSSTDPRAGMTTNPRTAGLSWTTR